MKWIFLFISLTVFMLYGCDSDDSVKPDDQVLRAFKKKYPNATHVEWEKRDNYLKVEFMNDDRTAHTAWFDQSGQWYMTETEFTRKDQLPQEIITAFEKSEYADGWLIDDLERLERYQAETVYVIEVKKDKQEIDLFYSADGILLKAQADRDDDYEDYLLLPSGLPVALRDFVERKYPDCRIIEYEIEHGLTEIEIIHENRSKEVVFNADGSWVNTHFDVFRSEIETIVMNALYSSAYKDYRIDDIEYYETPTGNYYLFELEKGEKEQELKITPTGTVL